MGLWKEPHGTSPIRAQLIGHGGEVWRELAAEQPGLVGRWQFGRTGLTRAFVRHRVETRRWTQHTHTVFSTTTGPLSGDQRPWLGVLHAGPGAMVGGLTAAGVHGRRMGPWAGHDPWGFRALLEDLSGGAQSVAEMDVRRACKKFGVWLPDRQRPRRDREGRRRWTDCECDLPDGRVLVLEVDGRFHREVLTYAADMKRQRELTTANRIVIRCAAGSSATIRDRCWPTSSTSASAASPDRVVGPSGCWGSHLSTRPAAGQPTMPYSRSPASPRPGTM